MVAAALIFGVVYVLIASEKVDKTIAAMLGAAVVVFSGLIPYEQALSDVDLNVIYLLVGMMTIVNILSTTGVFEWMAILVGQKAKGNGVVLLVLLLVVTAVVSAFLDNVTTIILIAPVTILITQILEIETIPFLILEAVFSNIGGTATLVGDPPNVLIGSRAHIPFNDFILDLGPIIAVIMVLSLVIIVRLLGKGIRPPEEAKSRLMRATPRKAIVNPKRLRRASVIFFMVVIGFFLSHLLHVEPGLIAIAGAFLMVLVCRVDVHDILGKVEWNTIMFFVGLFMLIGCLDYVGLFTFLGHHLIDLTQGNLLLTCISILWLSALLSAIVDNIPLVMSMIPLIKSIIPVFAVKMGLDPNSATALAPISEPLYWSLALGACLGGNGSLVGASANVVISQIAKRNNYEITFGKFTRYGLPLMLFSIVISSVYIYLRYFFW
ncbi:MAG: hypothetical protein DRH70_08440 [Candidatus Coatesbacteria bacterium]|nr:MAG: hypothetical protein DRH70_08440 [Candidatus Coatesbacteria bacterium]